MKMPALVAVISLLAGAETGAAARRQAQTLRWPDVPAAVQRRHIAAAVDAESFADFCRQSETRTRARVRESDLDALVYYALQSSAFTNEVPIEPALSAKAFVEGTGAIPVPVRRRLGALAAALRHPPPHSRLAYFREVVDRETTGGRPVADFLNDEYARATRFLYEKEFVARQRVDGGEAVAALYRDRALSTDTAVEAGYLVHLGLATLASVEPTRRIRRVLIVGPGLDLAPRTALVEVGAPESYQPYAVADSLLALHLARLNDLVVVGADVNPRVVSHLHAARSRDVVLTLVTGLGASDALTFDEGYRRYFTALGDAIGAAGPPPIVPDRYRGHLRKSVRIRESVARALDGVSLDIVTRRLDGQQFDLIVATNVFPYLDDRALMLALVNVKAMLAPEGVLVHNERRALVGEVARELNLPLIHSRTAVIANVRGSATPLYDSIFIHTNQVR
jgi:hypothetical protein